MIASATVTTPDGNVEQGVAGDKLAYYLSEAEIKPGYGFTDVVEGAAASFPIIYSGEPAEPEGESNADDVPNADAASPAPDPADETLASTVLDPAAPPTEPTS